MKLERFVRNQLIVFTVLTVVSIVVMGVFFMRIPTALGIGQYRVTIKLVNTGGLYATSNVTYRGSQVGRVTAVDLNGSEVDAVLELDSGTKIPRSARAEVHSRSAIGEQYVDMVPDSDTGPFLSDGDVISSDRTSVPQDIGPVIETLNKSLEIIPRDQLTSVIDSAAEGFDGNDAQLRRLFDSAGALLKDANGNIEPTKKLIRDARPSLNAQAVTSDSIREWASNLNSLTTQGARVDAALRNVLRTAPAAVGQADAILRQVRPTLPILLANLVSLGQVAVSYNPGIEQLLVVLPQGMGALQTIATPDADGSERGYLAFNTPTLNSTPPCTTGYLPASDRRDGSAQDTLPLPPTVYCAIPQNSQNAVRGARNIPCANNPAKRAPTVEICKSDEPYKALGTNPFAGDPLPIENNPVVPTVSPSAFTGAPPANGIRTAEYDPATGDYRGPDGVTYSQADLRTSSMQGGKTWQTMLTPAT